MNLEKGTTMSHYHQAYFKTVTKLTSRCITQKIRHTLEYSDQRKRMETILHNQKCWLTSDGRLEVYNHRLATRIDKFLKFYDDGGYSFKEGEEGLFRLSSNQIQLILSEFLTKK